LNGASGVFLRAIAHQLDEAEETDRPRRADRRMLAREVVEQLAHDDAHPAGVFDQLVFFVDLQRRERGRAGRADGCCR
jgi:hypothetical protein